VFRRKRPRWLWRHIACRRVEIRSLPLSDLTAPSTLILDLPDGIDTGWEGSIAPNLDTSMYDLLYERWKCAKQTGDIWKLPSVSPLPP
jgi:hypothetical protein